MDRDMTELQQALVELAAAGGEFQVVEGKLRVRPSPEPMLTRLVRQKPQILSMIGMKGGTVSAHDLAVESLSPDARADFEERAAIMEYEGGLDREMAERLALQDVCGRADK